jgi:hypothetical protein
MLFLFSCTIDANSETERIEVDNRTEEDVRIYYISVFKVEVLQTLIHYDEKRFVNFAPDVIYYARGEKTKKDYGDKIFVKLPSKIDVQRVWTIM